MATPDAPELPRCAADVLSRQSCSWHVRSAGIRRYLGSEVCPGASERMRADLVLDCNRWRCFSVRAFGAFHADEQLPEFRSPQGASV
jgi:hypothetical protein